MIASGLTYFVGVCFWAFTALYGVLASQAFIQEQFLTPRLFAPVAAFADLHGAIGMFVLAAWAATRRSNFSQPGSRSAWTVTIVWLAVTALFTIAMPLPGRHTTASALLIAVAGMSMILLLALAELQATAERQGDAPDRSRADLIACLLAAIGVTIVHGGTAVALDGPSLTVAGEMLQSLRLHLLLGSVAFLALAAIRGGAALMSRPSLSETVLSVVVLAAVLTMFMSTVLLPSISIRGPLALALGLGFGVALAGAAAARGAGSSDGSSDGVVQTIRSLSPKVAGHWWGLVLWTVCLLALAVSVALASRAMDWNFVLLRSGVALSWLLALSAALTFSQRLPDGGARTSFAIVALLLGGHIGLQSAVAPVQAASLRDASGKWLAEMLESGVQSTEGVQEFVTLLHSQTNIPRDKKVSAVDVDLATLSGDPAAARPHVFVFVVDSLRRDYLAPYNPAVTFTPAIEELARDSLVFLNAFTQYGATGLSVPSIWVGGSILHKQYVSSFPRMNALAKLLAHEQYDEWISMDRIMEVILPPSANRAALDNGVPVKNYRLCGTLAEIRSRLVDRPDPAPPIFASSLPQDVHVSVVNREGARSIDDHDYAGFYAPVASRVRRLDQCLAEFVGDLKTRGLYENSIIVLTSDHGDSLGEGGRMGHAYSLHPEIVRVPLIIHVPPALRSAWAWDEARPAFTTDITPTIYQLLGHEPTSPAPFFGESLARRAGAPAPAAKARMLAASYGAVYGALLDDGKRYYVFDAISMREMAFEIGDAPSAREVAVTPDVQQRGLKVIREAVEGIGTFYRFPMYPDSGS